MKTITSSKVAVASIVTVTENVQSKSRSKIVLLSYDGVSIFMSRRHSAAELFHPVLFLHSCSHGHGRDCLDSLLVGLALGVVLALVNLVAQGVLGSGGAVKKTVSCCRVMNR